MGFGARATFSLDGALAQLQRVVNCACTCIAVAAWDAAGALGAVHSELSTDVLSGNSYKNFHTTSVRKLVQYFVRQPKRGLLLLEASSRLMNILFFVS
jgi:hypothetical protein